MTIAAKPTTFGEFILSMDGVEHEKYYVDSGGLPVDAKGRSLHAYYSYPTEDLIIHVFPRHEWENADEPRTEEFSISQALQEAESAE